MKAVLADAPIVFFAVVIGVALTFRVAVGAVRDAAQPEPVAPTFATTGSSASTASSAPIVPIVSGPEPGLASGTASATGGARTTTTAEVAEIGAAAKVQPLGSPPKPPRKSRKPFRSGSERRAE